MVERVGLGIERLLTLGSSLELICRCVLLKYTLRLFSFEMKSPPRCGGPALQKASKQNPKMGALRWCG